MFYDIAFSKDWNVAFFYRGIVIESDFLSRMSEFVLSFPVSLPGKTFAKQEIWDVVSSSSD